MSSLASLLATFIAAMDFRLSIKLNDLTVGKILEVTEVFAFGGSLYSILSTFSYAVLCLRSWIPMQDASRLSHLQVLHTSTQSPPGRGRGSTQKCPPPGIRYELIISLGVQGCAHGTPERSETSPELPLPLSACWGWVTRE